MWAPLATDRKTMSVRLQNSQTLDLTRHCHTVQKSAAIAFQVLAAANFLSPPQRPIAPMAQLIALATGLAP